MKKSIFLVLSLILVVLVSGCVNNKTSTGKSTASEQQVQPNETEVIGTGNTVSSQPSETGQQQTTPPKQKVKSATLTIDRVQIQVANLYPTRVTVNNTGDVSISPKFDLYVYNQSNKEVCSGSPMVDEIRTLSPRENQTGELLVLGCMFKQDGTYTLKIDLLDSDYTKLDSQTKDFIVDYWNKFNLT